jgi:hypothetical protein
MARKKATETDDADETPVEDGLSENDQTMLEAGLTAVQLARINGTVMDGTSGNHTLGIDTSDALGAALAEQSRQAAQDRADSQSDEADEADEDIQPDEG